MIASRQKISVGIIDDHPIYRQGMASVLSEESFIAEIFEGESSEDAVEIAAEYKPEVMFLDLGIPGTGMSALQEIAGLGIETRCIIITSNGNADVAVEALGKGASGYVLKGGASTELTGAVETVLKGGTYVSPSFATSLLAAAQGVPPGRTGRAALLTEREVQMLDLLKTGGTNREIAENLQITERTVKFHMTNVMKKLGVTNRVAALIAFERAQR